ncbi:MAG: class I SAM-dependent methyltransferase [Sedimentisphaerales bacterium]|nr:class I SAM-dependent methyltransferase [Sedimentisphaerales bacterium]
MNCACCGGWDADRVIQTPDYELHIDAPFEISACRNCGHIYTSVRPGRSALFSKFYPDEYICYGGKRGVDGFMDRKRMEGQAVQRAKMIKKYVGQRNPVRLLEVGCATGEFIKTCRNRFGWEVAGIEPNRPLSDALNREGYPVLPSTLEDADIPDEQYDVVSLFNVLEHLWDPVYSLKRINRLLKPGGLAVLELPNFDSPSRKRFGKHWFLYHLPRHLSHFTKKSLTGLMNGCGFEKVDILKQFRPTVNVLSFQYAVQDRIRSNPVRSFCSARNPAMIAAGIFFELLQNRMGDSNIITAIFRKTAAVFQPIVSLLKERTL